MTTSTTRLTFAILAVVVTAGIVASAAAQQGDPAQQTGPVYALEGAWYGMVTISGMGSTPSLDTFTSNAQRHGVEGSALCTIPAVGRMPNPSDPDGWLASTPSAHGNWVRIATNRHAFTMVRTIFDHNGMLFGWARFWGTITPVSDNEYMGTMNAQYYLPDGTTISPLFTGTLHSHRIDITFEQ